MCSNCGKIEEKQSGCARCGHAWCAPLAYLCHCAADVVPSAATRTAGRPVIAACLSCRLLVVLRACRAACLSCSLTAVASVAAMGAAMRAAVWLQEM